MILVGPDGALVVQDAVVEVVSWDGVVELGVGATGWIHAGVVVDVQPGAVAYLATGAHADPVRPGELERGDITLTPWTAQQRPPEGTLLVDPRRVCPPIRSEAGAFIGVEPAALSPAPVGRR